MPRSGRCLQVMFITCRATVDTEARTRALLKAIAGGTGSGDPSAETGRLTIGQPPAGGLILDGELDGRKTRIELRQYDRSGFRLLQTRFRGVQDHPFNR